MAEATNEALKEVYAKLKQGLWLDIAEQRALWNWCVMLALGWDLPSKRCFRDLGQILLPSACIWCNGTRQSPIAPGPCPACYELEEEDD